MTEEQLQQYLDIEKWKDSEQNHADMCGRYRRCRYCRRSEEHPCAKAFSRLVTMRTQPVPDIIPEWLLPDPPVEQVFGTEIVSEERSRCFETEEVSCRVLRHGKGGIRLLSLTRKISEIQNTADNSAEDAV